MDSRPSQATVRRALRRDWEADGRPPCPICCRPITEGEKACASLARQAVVHRLCSTVDVPGPVALIVAAHSEGLATIDVPTADSPGCERAAREAGLGAHYQAPFKESRAGAALLKHGVVTDEEAFSEPSRWYQPPELLTVDVPRSIREGRIVARA